MATELLQPGDLSLTEPGHGVYHLLGLVLEQLVVLLLILLEACRVLVQ